MCAPVLLLLLLLLLLAHLLLHLVLLVNLLYRLGWKHSAMLDEQLDDVCVAML